MKTTTKLSLSAAAGTAIVATALLTTRTPAPRETLIPFRYPPGAETNFWAVERSTNLIDWQTVLRNCYGPPEGVWTATNTGEPGLVVFRGRQQKGYEK